MLAGGVMMAGTGIFLTGATGHAGQYVLAELQRRGMTVTALVRREVRLEGCRTVSGDLAALEGVLEEILSADGIIHLASPRSQEREYVVLDDIVGTGVLTDAWRSGPFIYASSPTVHGIPRDVLTETSPIDI